VPANIAEGCGRMGDRELVHFLSIACGSATELEYHLLLARDLGFLTDAEHGRLRARTDEIQKMLISLLKRASGGDQRP
jgi:four helix bundle protein